MYDYVIQIIQLSALYLLIRCIIIEGSFVAGIMFVRNVLWNSKIVWNIGPCTFWPPYKTL